MRTSCRARGVLADAARAPRPRAARPRCARDTNRSWSTRPAAPGDSARSRTLVVCPAQQQLAGARRRAAARARRRPAPIDRTACRVERVACDDSIAARPGSNSTELGSLRRVVRRHQRGDQQLRGAARGRREHRPSARRSRARQALRAASVALVRASASAERAVVVVEHVVQHVRAVRAEVRRADAGAARRRSRSERRSGSRARARTARCWPQRCSMNASTRPSRDRSGRAAKFGGLGQQFARARARHEPQSLRRREPARRRVRLERKDARVAVLS